MMASPRCSCGIFASSPCEDRFGVVGLARQDQQRRAQLRCAFRVRRELLPELNGRQRVVGTLCGNRNLGCALGETRVVRITREREIRLVSGRCLAALQRDFGREYLEHDLAGRRNIGQVLCFLARGRRCNQVGCADRGLVVVRSGELRRTLSMGGAKREHCHGERNRCRKLVRWDRLTACRNRFSGRCTLFRKQLNEGQVHGNPINVSVDCIALATIRARPTASCRPVKHARAAGSRSNPTRY